MHALLTDRFLMVLNKKPRFKGQLSKSLSPGGDMSLSFGKCSLLCFTLGISVFSVAASGTGAISAFRGQAAMQHGAGMYVARLRSPSGKYAVRLAVCR
jgi:hypothetical protein